MADSTTFHRFVLAFTSNWGLGGQATHTWHSKFSVSGTIDMTEADAEATALDLAQPILSCCQTHTFLAEYSYYPSGTNVAKWSKVYPLGTHNGTNDAYSGTTAQQQLEVCILVRAALPDKNSLGKPTYLRKYVHDVQCLLSDPNQPAARIDETALLKPWNNGSGPHSVVPVSPKTGNPGDKWVIEPHLYTHQLRRGRKRKIVTAGNLVSVQDFVNAAGGLAAAMKLLSELPKVP